MKKLTIKQIAQACGGEIYFCEENTQISNIEIDNRRIEEGGLFVPIIGENHDGHSFIEKAFEAGAICTLSDRPVNFSHIRVKSTLAAFQAIAKYYMEISKVPVVGITGSVGKTTTKDMISCVLAEAFVVHKTHGNFNNETGVPLTVFAMPENSQIAVIEMGMNHLGEIDRLAQIVKPDICVLTNIGEAHIENLGSKDGILQAKSEMLAHAKDGGCTIINGDDEYLLKIKDDNIVKAGFINCDIFPDDITEKGFEGVEFFINYGAQKAKVKLSVPGNHMITNALIATGVGIKLGLNLKQIATGLEKFSPSKGRMHISRKNGYTVIDDAYNANPTSMAAAIRTLGKANGRKVLVLGDMLELGQNENKYHEEIGKLAVECGIDLTICVGVLSKNAYNAAKKLGADALHYSDLASVQSQIDSVVQQGDYILVKASHGTGLYKLEL